MALRSRPAWRRVPDYDGVSQGLLRIGLALHPFECARGQLASEETSVADQGADLRVNTAFRREVADRFGVIPNFFCSADAAPGLIEELWKFARSAYLDSPLPSLFKERR